jgi:hypothetical protein
VAVSLGILPINGRGPSLFGLSHCYSFGFMGGFFNLKICVSGENRSKHRLEYEVNVTSTQGRKVREEVSCSV